MGTPSNGGRSPRIQSGLRGGRLLARTVCEHHAIGPKLGIQARDAVQVDVEQCGCGDGAVHEHPRLLRGAGEGEVGWIHVTS
jgi:hypothetical protein